MSLVTSFIITIIFFILLGLGTGIDMHREHKKAIENKCSCKWVDDKPIKNVYKFCRYHDRDYFDYQASRGNIL